MLSHSGLAVLPEDTAELGATWRDGACGTGPFRIAELIAGRRLELERHPAYWRPGLPRVERLVFERFDSPAEVLRAFRDGRLALAGGLLPGDVEKLRREPLPGGDFQESPSLSIYYLALNARRGPLAEAQTRQAVVACLDLDRAVDSLGRLVRRARGLVPPGLLGHEPAPGAGTPAEAAAAGLDRGDAARLRGLRLKLAVHPIFADRYAELRDRLLGDLGAAGVEIEKLDCEVAELSELARSGDVDLVLSRWIAVYPDPDCFMTGFFDPDAGVLNGLVGSPQLAALCERGRLEADLALRHNLYRNLESILARENRVVPLFHEQTCRFARPEVRGLQLSITVPEVHYEELSFEAVPSAEEAGVG
jgi:peptide/nickel transport system substrate-binding protein